MAPSSSTTDQVFMTPLGSRRTSFAPTSGWYVSDMHDGLKYDLNTQGAL